ncbi:MAG TPA: hypothetical protein DCE41_36970 [Cytophagales bacterium]|nr:hypothetical protein [Cytophagales bacterium]HAA21164.1 hypothetical protein [Cytophagales bacterium]HAP60684.1 hypothetical protein [Cytophagales bacterium]
MSLFKEKYKQYNSNATSHPVSQQNSDKAPKGISVSFFNSHFSTYPNTITQPSPLGQLQRTPWLALQQENIHSKSILLI